jgi:DNA-binding Xre family transcriptional regulator
MAVRYNKLWKILIDKKMKKKDLQEAAHITHYQMMKLSKVMDEFGLRTEELNSVRIKSDGSNHYHFTCVR